MARHDAGNLARRDTGDLLLLDPFVVRVDQSTGTVSFLDNIDKESGGGYGNANGGKDGC
jgi:hypothetical protein